MTEKDKLAIYITFSSCVTGFAILFDLMSKKDDPKVKAFIKQISINDKAMAEWAGLNDNKND